MFEELFGWFQAQGLVYALIGLFLILLIDSTIFPALPEIFATLAFLMPPDMEWGLMVLATACAAELAGNTILYAAVKRGSLPGFIKRAMDRWTDFLFVGDERIILINRVAPVVPFTGAFIAGCGWNYRRSMLYLVTGGLLKYGALLLMVALFDYRFDRSTAALLSIVAVLTVVVLSLLASYVFKKRRFGRPRDGHGACGKNGKQ